MDPLSAARYGMMTAGTRLAASAARVAGRDGEDLDLVQETVEQVQARLQFSASARVVRFADEMWRALLDVQAK
jgi:hypothetical protein